MIYRVCSWCHKPKGLKSWLLMRLARVLRINLEPSHGICKPCSNRLTIHDRIKIMKDRLEKEMDKQIGGEQ